MPKGQSMMPFRDDTAALGEVDAVPDSESVAVGLPLPLPDAVVEASRSDSR